LVSCDSLSFDALTSNLSSDALSCRASDSTVNDIDRIRIHNLAATPKVYNRTTVVIPSRCMKRVDVFTDEKLTADIFINPRKDLEYAKNIAIGKVIIKIIKGRGHTYVTNLTRSPVKILRNCHIGLYEVFEENQILCDMDELEICQSKSLNGINSNLSDASYHSAQTAVTHCPPSEVLDTEVQEELISKFGNDLSPAEKHSLKNLLNKYADIFSRTPNNIGRTHLTKHTIDTGNAQPIRQRPYRVSALERNEIRCQCDDMLANDIIEFSHSPWASPVVLIKKPDNTFRFCCDFRKLNAVTKKDCYPLMRIDEALDRLKGTTRFSMMDCNQAFYQVEVDERDRDKTAFITSEDLFRWKVMPF